MNASAHLEIKCVKCAECVAMFMQISAAVYSHFFSHR